MRIVISLVLAGATLLARPVFGQLNACVLLSTADAQSILGAPMKQAKTQNPKVCMYEEASPKEGASVGRVSLTVNERASADAETRGWASLKEVRHLKAGEKNVQTLTGIGNEAYFTGNVEKGKIGVAAVVARKGRSDLMLDVMVLEYRASPDALKALAKRIADQLP